MSRDAIFYERLLLWDSALPAFLRRYRTVAPCTALLFASRFGLHTRLTRKKKPTIFSKAATRLGEEVMKNLFGFPHICYRHLLK